MTYLLIYLLLGLPVLLWALFEARAKHIGILTVPFVWVGWWIVLAALVWVVLLRIKRAGKCAFCGATFDGDDEMRAHIAECEKHPLREMARNMEAK